MVHQLVLPEGFLCRHEGVDYTGRLEQLAHAAVVGVKVVLQVLELEAFLVAHFLPKVLNTENLKINYSLQS